MEVPLLELRRQSAALRAELMDALARVVSSGHYILGEEVESFERDVAAFLGSTHAIGVGNGTDAIWLALRASGLSAGDGVLTTPFTFIGTVSPVLNVGADPVFVDIEPRTLNIDPESVRDVLDGRSDVHRRLGVRPESIKALLPVHLYGGSAVMHELRKIAEDFNLILIEDAAQALGAEYRSQMVGTFGDIGCFSFFPSKNLGAFGDAGLVITPDPGLAQQVKILRTQGTTKKYYSELVGTNSRLDAIQAAILRVKLSRLVHWRDQRRRHASFYDHALDGVPAVEAPSAIDDSVHCYHQYTVTIDNGSRDALQAFLTARGVGTAVYYPVPLHLQPALQHLGYGEGDFPRAEDASKKVLSLPIFPELTEEERSYVVDALCSFDWDESETS